MKFTYTKGFTLIELLVTVSITTVLMTVVLFNYSTFIDNLAVGGAEQEVAATIRQAQTYGLNVRETGVSSGQFDYGYGVYFDPGSNPTIYIPFVDSDANKRYTVQSGCGGSTECMDRIAYRNGVRVTSVCDSTACYSNKTLSISFLRPIPDANIYITYPDGSPFLGPLLSARIELKSPKNKLVYVTVESTGQVLVQ